MTQEKRISTVAGGLLALTFILMLLLPEDAADKFSTVFLPILAWADVALNYWALRRLHSSLPDHRLVRLLLPASILWALGETIWGVLYLSLDQIPDPSVADLFWLLGNLIFLYALGSALRWYPQHQTATLRRLRWGLLLGILLLSLYFVIWPMAQAFSWEEWKANAVNLLYPILDTALLMTVVALMVHMRRGQLWQAWMLIGLSVANASFADLFYFYLDWHDLYYAPQTLWLSRLTDWLFLADYILYGWGMMALVHAWSRATRLSEASMKPVERPHISFANALGLLYLDGEDRVIGYAGVLWERVVQPPPLEKPLLEIWSDATSREEYQTLLNTLRREGKLFPAALKLPGKKGPWITCWVSGVAIAPGGTYEGANLLVRGYLPDLFDPFLGLSAENAGLARFLAHETGVQIPDYRQAMHEYAQRLWRTLTEALTQQFGPEQTHAIIDELQQAHAEHFHLAPQEVRLTESAAAEPNLEVLRDAYRDLLSDLRSQAAHFLSAPVISHEVAKAESRMEASLLWMAEELGLRSPRLK